MAQRAIVERQRRIHGVLPTGRIIPVICGAETDPLGDPNQQLPDPASGGDGLGNGVTGGAPDPAAAAATTPRMYSEEEVNAVRARMTAADRRAAELEQKNKEYENASKSEVERAKIEAQEATERAEAAEKALVDMRIHNAFLTSNKFDWQNPAAALRLIDLSNVTVNESGDVTGLDAAIEALSKSDPYLLKPKVGTPSGSKPAGNAKPSGSNPSANGGSNGRGEDRAALLKKYPSLRR